MMSYLRNSAAKKSGPTTLHYIYGNERNPNNQTGFQGFS